MSNQTTIQYFRQPVIVLCDEKCNKAWGINSRPKEQLSENEDDYAFLSDSELGEAPEDPGTYEGGQGKPSSSKYFPNKWCVRECERCGRFYADEEIIKPDFSKRVYNIKTSEVK
jgi:hypothetical protein